jgi:signal transduction histidine kinase
MRRNWAPASLSLRAQVALVVALLSFLPNALIAGPLLLSAYERLGQLGRDVYLPLLGWLVAIALLSGLIGYLLSGYLLAPLNRLTEQLETLAHVPEALASARLTGGTGDPSEIAALKGSFNGLLAQVRLEQERRRSFMATLVHDLKTPLIAIQRLLEVVRDNDGLTRQERVEVVSQLSRENEALIGLVQKMVDAYKFERADVRLKPQPQDVAPILARVAARVKPLADERLVTLEVRGNTTASVDARELERALYNLLSNAVRYARSQIQVEVFAGVVRITDDGPGLPAPLEKLAQPFNAQPIAIAGQSFTAGTAGLGLFIARRILELHGGKLVTETTGRRGTSLLAYLGKGATPPEGAPPSQAALPTGARP